MEQDSHEEGTSGSLTPTQPEGDSNKPPKVRQPKEPKVKLRRKKEPPPTIPKRPYFPLSRAHFEITGQSAPSSDKSSKYLPRLGTFTLRRNKAPVWKWKKESTEEDGSKIYTESMGEDVITLTTPAILCGAARGMVKHLSRDNVALSRGTEWVHIPFEEFLEHPTPIPALHPATLPLHTFLTYPPSRHILSLSLRDPSDNQNMPANTNVWVQAKTVRGVRKVTVQDWITWSKALRPDILWAFVDVPKTLLNGGAKAAEETVVVKGEGRQTSQKRTTKSLERSTLWLQTLMGELKEEGGKVENKKVEGEEAIAQRPPIIVPLLGGCDARARNEYSLALIEKLDRADSSRAGGLRKLDDGIMGYAVDLVDLPTNCYSSPPSESSSPANQSDSEDENNQDAMTELLQTSLKPLSASKPRIAHSAPSPHAILRIILESGFDLFDAPWVAEAADLGIALDFDFPVVRTAAGQSTKGEPIGLNLFEERFADDFTTLSPSVSSWVNEPTFNPNPILHSTVDQSQWGNQAGEMNEAPGFTKAYIHHLLHTHEMSAYALLHMHNLAVITRFFEGIRSVLETCLLSSENETQSFDRFRKEIQDFYERYSLPDVLFDEARTRWKEVEDARGKGSLKRERDIISQTENIDSSAMESGIGDPEEVMPSQDGQSVVGTGAANVIAENITELQ
ncbi:hypothetical protein CPB86DRAFT_727241 [Serendipita vermifera]|nr:hypothetical protein CPB86DRAFT_727241 [Serendipita vermifera]